MLCTVALWWEGGPAVRFEGPGVGYCYVQWLCGGRVALQWGLKDLGWVIAMYSGSVVGGWPCSGV